MENNPWEVDGIEMFLHFKCPECSFLTRKDHIFQDHAVENHPLSFSLFSEKLQDGHIANMLKVEMGGNEETMDLDDDNPGVNKSPKSYLNCLGLLCISIQKI